MTTEQLDRNFNPREDPDLRRQAGGDQGYLERMVAVKLARRRVEADPSDVGALDSLEGAKIELEFYRYDHPELLPHPPDETSH
jgi:hypothetical protein